MTVNALVTGLIVFKILKIFREVRVTSDKGALSRTGGAQIWSIIFIMIESGMVLIFIQLARVVVSIVITDAARDAFELLAGIHQIFNVITISVSVPFYFTDNVDLARV
jgi:hypothetical protein